MFGGTDRNLKNIPIYQYEYKEYSIKYCQYWRTL